MLENFGLQNIKDNSHLILEIVIQLMELKIKSGRVEEATIFFYEFLTSESLVLEKSECSKLHVNFSSRSLQSTYASTILNGFDLTLAWFCFLHLLIHKSIPMIFFSPPHEYCIKKEYFLVSWPKLDHEVVTSIDQIFLFLFEGQSLFSSDQYFFCLFIYLFSLTFF